MEGYYYDNIALDYDLKRKKPWKALESFVSYIEEKEYSFNGINLDLGCANGRHFKLFKSSTNKIIGIDNSIDFLRIAHRNLRDLSQYEKKDSNNIQTILGDVRSLPLRPDIIQNMFSIATIHHIQSKDTRKKVLEQMFKLTKENGLILLTVWRRWQNKYKKEFIFEKIKRLFNPRYKKKQTQLGLNEFGDKIIPWTVSSTNITHERYYHFFSKNEIKRLMNKYKISEFKIMGGSTDKDNFFILAQRL
jgi:SAM-dependent methyltransferase